MPRWSIPLGWSTAVLTVMLGQFSWSLEPLRFRAHVINPNSEFTACAALDVNADGSLDIVSGGWWYAAPLWTPHKLREVEKIGTRFDDYSNLPLDVDGDGDLDLVSINYRSKSIYWARNPGPKSSELWEKVVIETPGPSETGRLVDIDGDGVLDILPNGTTFAAWYRRTSPPPDPTGAQNSANLTATFTRYELPPELAGHGLGSGDVNGDGRLDLVCPTGWAEGPADPRQDRWIWHPDFRLARDGSIPILVVDVDGDGDSDLIWSRGHNVGVYWTEQLIGASKQAASSPNAHDAAVNVTLNALGNQARWRTHAIDTSFSCIHSPLWEDLDGDGTPELIAGKRFQGHEGKDPGENEPLRIVSYQFDKTNRVWHSRVISRHLQAGLDLDPKCVDIDGDNDLDIIAPSRAGLVLLENLRTNSQSVPDDQLASFRPQLPARIDHQHFDQQQIMGSGTEGTQPIANQLDMGKRREQIQQQMEVVMGQLPGSDRRVALNVQIEKVERVEKYTRIKLSYAPEPDDRVPAWLLIPHDMQATAPAVLCLHPTHVELGKDQLLGLGGKPSRFYAHELAERGFICLVPDYPSFGEYKYDFKTTGKHYSSGTMKAIWNNIRALDLLESLPIVAPDKIGCLGHSLGGHNAIYTAAFDVRIRAVMSSCGFNTFEDYYGGNLKGWTSDRYMPLIASQFGSDPKRMPFDFPEVLAAISPRPLLVNAPLKDANFAVEGVRKCQVAVEPVYKLLGKSANVTFLYPDAEHDFPQEIRDQTYAWFAQQLK